MAVVVRTIVNGVDDQAAHDRLDEAVNANIGRAGGPPPGHMAHSGHPSTDGDLVLVQVFGNAESFHAWWAEVVAPTLESLGLTSGPHEVRPVWSFARP